MAERIVLDPAEVATSRTALDITPWVDAEGIDWGDAEIQTYMADQSRGAAPVDFRVPNRTITVPLALKTVGGTTFAAARTAVQAKASLFQRERGWLKRVAASGSIVFADVVNATLKLGGGWGQAHRGYDMDAQLVLEAQPDFYGAEVTLSDHVSPGNTELVFTETQIQGDYPARVRIVVDEDDAERQLGLLWGIRSRTYSSAATARLAYNAGTMTPQDTAAVESVTHVRHTTVSTVWTPVLSTDIVPTGPLTHVGTYRLWTLLQPMDSTDKTMDVRLLWDVGDLASPVENDAVRIPDGATNAFALDLGEIRLDAAPSGTHRWRGQIQAKAATAPADLRIRKVWIVPVDEGYGVLRAPITGVDSFSSYRVRDGFDQTAGTLNGKTVAVGGGTFSTFQNGPFAPTDYQVTGGGAITRTSDAEFYRTALAGTAVMSNTVVQMDASWGAVPAAGSGFSFSFILIARWTTVDNFAGLYVNPGSGLVLLGRWTTFSGGVAIPTTVGTHGGVWNKSLLADTWYTVRMQVFDNGFIAGWVGPQGAPFGAPLVTGRHADFATGGALDDGRVGWSEEHNLGVPVTNTYDNFGAYAANMDAVLHPSQSAELRWDGTYREDAAGVGWGPVPFPTGDNPRLPPAGLENRTCEVFIRSSRGDYDQLPDNDFDAFSARVFYRPCWLFVS